LVVASGRNAALDASCCCAGRGDESLRKPPHQLNCPTPGTRRSSCNVRQPASRKKSPIFTNCNSPFSSCQLPLLILILLTASFSRSVWKSPLSSNDKQSNNRGSSSLCVAQGFFL
jgi:hypothetical protein